MREEIREEIQFEDINTIQYYMSKILFGLYSVTKRVFDIVCVLIGCIFLLFPLVFIVKIITLLNKDTFTIFYKHIRIGKDGKEFYLYKFRSMVPKADEALNEILKDPKYKKEWEENHKFKNDPRITKIGKILRKTSLDELPQLLNVLKGDMSLIGPRPLVRGELDAHKGNHEIYEKVKPGITGWWACNGRSDLTYKQRLELEYYYVLNQSLILDIKCFFKTISAVLERKGSR